MSRFAAESRVPVQHDWTLRRETAMLISRTTGSASVVPELVYADVAEAIQWLCETFGFAELWRLFGSERGGVTRR